MTDIFVALSDATRRKILDTLQSKPGQSVSELVALTGESQPTVSKHLKTLKDAGLVTSKVSGKNHLYSIATGGFATAASWISKFESADGGLLEEKLGDAGEKLGAWLAAGSTWVGEKIGEKVNVSDIEAKAEKLGRELGRKLADAKAQAEKAAKEAVSKIKRD